LLVYSGSQVNTLVLQRLAAVLENEMRSYGFLLSVAVAASMLFPCRSMGQIKTLPGFARAEARSSTWISVEAPFVGDVNENGYTIFRIGPTATGPFTRTSTLPAAGPSGWRGEFIPRLTPNTDYYIQVEYLDPIDGVGDNSIPDSGPGAKLQVLGPIRTRSSAPLSVRVERAIAESRTNEILVSVPISDDANGNSGATFEVAEDIRGAPDASLSWTQRCGPSGSVHPKLCRIRSLTPGRSYRIRINMIDRDGITDADGIVGARTQVLGPLVYSGGKNVAFGKPVAVDPPGWGCCADPRELTDGRIQYEDSPHGFAWPGGTGCHNGGCPPGNNKTATVDLGGVTRINRTVIWFHDAQSVAQSWEIETSVNGTHYTRVHRTETPQCRDATFPIRTDWSYPACAHTGSFSPVDARYVRYRFNDATLFRGQHGWVLEFEVFQAGVITASPVSEFTQVVNVPSEEQAVTLQNTGLAPVTLLGMQVQPAGRFSFIDRCPNVLNVGAICRIGIRFTSSTVGTSSAAFSVTHDGAESPAVVELRGTATPMGPTVLTASPTSLRLPSVSVGAISTEEKITVQHIGGPPLTGWVGLANSYGPFKVTDGCVGLSGGCTIFVRFEPTAPGSFSATLPLRWTGGSQDVRVEGVAREDSDGDGIPDQWERGEVEILGERINLNAMGARVGVKDIFVEIDYLRDATHGHEPKREAIQKVVDKFWEKGIALHVDCGPECMMDPLARTTWGEAMSRSNAVSHIDPITESETELGFQDDLGNYNWSSFDRIKALHLSPARSLIFRYAVFAHNLGGEAATGLSRVQLHGSQKTASDFIVSLGGTANFVGNVLEQAGTFMHELGHNLGLTHGGCPASRVNCDQVNYKPNYLSVMNYLFQSRGLIVNSQDGVIDYSNDQLLTLNEAVLPEATGLGAPAGVFGTRYWCDLFGERPVLQANGRIDWDCNGVSNTALEQDINHNNSKTDNLLGAKDWDRLKFVGGAVGFFGAPPPQPEVTPIDELTPTEDKQITTIFGVAVISGDSLRLSPASSGSVSFTVENRGSRADTFRLTVTPTPSIASWVNASSVPAQISLGVGQRLPITLPVTAPGAGGFGRVALRAESSNNPRVFDVGRVAVTSGLADVSLSVTDSPDPLVLGNRLTYSVVVRNLGPDGARDLAVNADLPASLGPLTTSGAACLGTTKMVCSVGNLAVGESAIITIRGTPQNAGALQSTFVITSATTDPNSASNTVVTNTTVSGRPILTAAVTGQTRSGSNLTVQVSMRNAGSEPVRQLLVSGISARVLAGSGTVIVSSPAVPVTVGNLAPGQAMTLPITLSVPSSVTRFTLTQSGSVQDAQGSSFSFSLAQAVTP